MILLPNPLSLKWCWKDPGYYQENVRFGRDLNTLNCRGVTLNLGDGVVSFGEEKLELSRNEYKILEILMKKKGNVVPREDLIQALWDTEEFIDENTLTVNVARLRQRLKQIGVEELISTRKVWGI